MNKELEALINIGAIFVSCICNEDGDIDYCHLRDHNDYINWYNTVEQALKRNEPMKPQTKTYTNGFFKLRACSVCGNTIQKEFVCCPYCGQALDWSDEE